MYELNECEGDSASQRVRARVSFTEKVNNFRRNLVFWFYSKNSCKMLTFIRIQNTL
jgi:hypothetical protein